MFINTMLHLDQLGEALMVYFLAILVFFGILLSPIIAALIACGAYKSFLGVEPHETPVAGLTGLVIGFGLGTYFFYLLPHLISLYQ